MKSYTNYNIHLTTLPSTKHYTKKHFNRSRRFNFMTYNLWTREYLLRDCGCEKRGDSPLPQTPLRGSHFQSSKEERGSHYQSPKEVDGDYSYAYRYIFINTLFLYFFYLFFFFWGGGYVHGLNP